MGLEDDAAFDRRIVQHVEEQVAVAIARVMLQALCIDLVDLAAHRGHLARVEKAADHRVAPLAQLRDVFHSLSSQSAAHTSHQRSAILIPSASQFAAISLWASFL